MRKLFYIFLFCFFAFSNAVKVSAQTIVVNGVPYVKYSSDITLETNMKCIFIALGSKRGLGSTDTNKTWRTAEELNEDQSTGDFTSKLTVFTLVSNSSSKTYSFKGDDGNFLYTPNNTLTHLTHNSSNSNNNTKFTITAEGYVMGKISTNRYVAYESGYFKHLVFGNTANDEGERAVLYVAGNVLSVSQHNFSSLYFKNLAIKVPTGLTAYTLKLDDNGQLVSQNTYKANSVIPKATPVIVQGKSGSYKLVAQESTSSAPSGNLLRGLEKKGIIPYEDGDSENETHNYYYKLTTKNGSDFGFYWGAAGGKPFQLNNDHRAYLVIPKSAFKADETQAAQGFSLFQDLLLTGTQAITPGENLGISPSRVSSDNVIYTLDGRRVATDGPLPKGIYIRGGKKVVF